MNKDRIFRVEAYYKLYKDLVKTVPISYNYFGYNNSGSGYAKGIEVFRIKTFKDFDYWIGYTYLNTGGFYEQSFRSLRLCSHQYGFDRNEKIYRMEGWIQLTYTYASGRLIIIS
jgi:hypothetical protein